MRADSRFARTYTDALPAMRSSSELMTDPKARKVIVLENPMLPTAVKQSIIRILFERLSVPSVSFALSPLCALLSIGRITGLVVDVGNLETCTLPVRLRACLSLYRLMVRLQDGLTT